MQPGYYTNIPNADYHAGPGISKSILDLAHKAPALVEWNRRAPRDEQAVGATDLGDAFHALLLEPERFHSDFIVAPAVDRRTKAGKEEYAEFLDAARGRKVLDADDARKLGLMRESALAHPFARRLLEAEGDVEASIYWTDPDTGLLCRCRPDKRVTAHRILLDVKTCADVARFATSVEEYRYHVQDAFYSEGEARCFGEPPAAFLFLVVSTSLDAGRYPTRLFALTPSEREAGRTAWRKDLDTIAECERTGIWPGIETISRPAWAAARSAA